MHHYRCLTYLEHPTAVVFDGRGPMFRACAKFGPENGTNEGETARLKCTNYKNLQGRLFLRLSIIKLNGSTAS